MCTPELQRVVRLYSRAERSIKRAERITLQLPVAPVNQLRYAGFHILRAIDACRMPNADVDARHEDIRKAENHCRRSWLDAFECTLLYLLKSVQKMYQEAARLEPFWSMHPELGALQDEINSIQSDFLKVPISASMSVSWRLRLIHEAQRLGRIKRQILRAYSSDGKGGNGTPRTRALAKKVALSLADRQFLVSITATLCGTFIGFASLIVCIFTAESIQCKVFWLIISLLGSGVMIYGVWHLAKRYLLSK